MSLVYKILLTGAIALGLLAPGLPCMAADKAAKVERPAIFVDADRLARLNLKVKKQSPLWRRLMAWAADPARNRAALNEAPGLVLAALLIKDQVPSLSRSLALKAVDAAMEAVSKPPSKKPAVLGPMVRDLALTLDWGYGFLQAGQRKKAAAWLVKAAWAVKDKGRGGFDLDSARCLRLTLLAGLAARGLHPDAQKLVSFALDTRFKNEVLPCLMNRGRGGGWFEGPNLGSVAGLCLAESMAAAKTALKRDEWAGVPWFDDRLAYLAYNLLPGFKISGKGYKGYRRPAPWGGDHQVPDRLAVDMTRLQMLLLADLWPRNRAAGWARALLLGTRQTGVTNPADLVHEFIWLVPNVEVAALAANTPLSYVAPATGEAFSRSDWSGRATWLGFKCGPHYTRAQNLDAGSLWLFRARPLTAPGGLSKGDLSPYDLNFAKRSVAANTVLIRDDKEYSWYDMGKGPKPKGTYANDGGQRAWALFGKDGLTNQTAPWGAKGWNSRAGAWSGLKDIYDVANIVSGPERQRFAYFKGDMTRAYKGSTQKAARVVRHVFHLRAGGPHDAKAGELIAVVDDVVLAKEGPGVSFVTHLTGEPQLMGGVKKTAAGRYEGKSGKVRSYNNQSRLDLVCLWPPQPRTRLYTAAGKAAYQVDGKNYPPPNSSPWAGGFRVEMGYGKEAGLNRPLVHALIPAEKKDEEPARVTALDSPDAAVTGLVVHDSLWPRVVAVRLGVVDESAKVVYSHPGGRSRHLVAGLAPGAGYKVSLKPGAVIIEPGSGLTAGPGGLISFMIDPDAEGNKK